MSLLLCDRVLVYEHLHVCVHASACVCIMSVLSCAICVRASGPGDPGAPVWFVWREKDGERRGEEAYGLLVGWGRPLQLYLE